MDPEMKAGHMIYHRHILEEMGIAPSTTTTTAASEEATPARHQLLFHLILCGVVMCGLT
jgi:hypothetical protein